MNLPKRGRRRRSQPASVHRRLKRVYAILCAGRDDAKEAGQPRSSLNELTQALEDELAAIAALGEELAREMVRLRAIVARRGRARERLASGAGSGDGSGVGSGDSPRDTGALEKRIDALRAWASELTEPVRAEDDWPRGRNRTTSGHGRLPLHRYRRPRRVRPWAAK